ncbi:MAG: 1-deoxy-D-xylulose-5-phosphate synthase [Blautia sp.]|nr:1-deoxy-D-xylulose-5-phosphate synthase [Blautia sp.]
MVLERINGPNDIKKIPLSDFPLLAEEIRDFLIRSVSETGGHLASNLGVVELTMALHNVLDLTEDKLIWDVGHQSYTHKILTGRKDLFSTLRQEGGLSGFPKRSESPCDAFDTGHSSTSISAGLGYVRARELQHLSYRVVSVIGDGALTGGMAFEALNNAALLETNFIIVLNDNDMSISRNVGGMSSYLGAIRTAGVYTGMKMSVTKALNRVPAVGEHIVESVRRTKSSIKTLFIPGMLFENIGLTYLGPVDGHDLRQMMRAFNEAKKVPGPVIVHVLTEKGHGYEPARKNPEQFHGTGPFEISTGEQLKKSTKKQYTDVFSEAVTDLGENNRKVCAITAAMPDGTGLNRFSKAFPERFFDVGIAEEHAVTFASGLALGGMLPVVCVYSSFLQRGIDQILHDVCMQKLHVIFALDRSGIVGADGETHHGCFDIAYLTMMPDMTVMAPSSEQEMWEMLKLAAALDGPCALRYPKGPAYTRISTVPVEHGRAEVIKTGGDACLIALGSRVKVAIEAAQELEKEGISVTVVNARFAKPMDTELFSSLTSECSRFVTIEEGAVCGGFGEQAAAFLHSCRDGLKVKCLGIPDRFIKHGKAESLLAQCGLAPAEAAEAVRQILN